MIVFYDHSFFSVITITPVVKQYYSHFTDGSRRFSSAPCDAAGGAEKDTNLLALIHQTELQRADSSESCSSTASNTGDAIVRR